MKTLFLLAILGASMTGCKTTDLPVVYRNNFESETVGDLPNDILILDGDFVVSEDGENRAVRLPGNPVRRFGFLVGPVMTGNGSISARVRSERRGRRYPQFGVGLKGIRGVRLQVAPAKKAIELLSNNQVITSTEFKWEAGVWADVSLRIHGDRAFGEVLIDGAQPVTIDAKLTSPAPNGRASIWGTPYSGEPIWFDDLLLRD